ATPGCKQILHLLFTTIIAVTIFKLPEQPGKDSYYTQRLKNARRHSCTERGRMRAMARKLRRGQRRWLA
ncbi:unnamed protein product, partial [Ascophyllum nodosum]